MQIFFWKIKINLTHWGRVTHICVSKLTIIGSDNCLSPERRQTNIWTNAGILLIGTLGTNFTENLSELHTFSFTKMHLKTSSAKRRPFYLGLIMLNGLKAQYCSSLSRWLSAHIVENRLFILLNYVFTLPLPNVWENISCHIDVMDTAKVNLFAL